MPFAWKPVPGQVALIELASGGRDCLTGVVIADDSDDVVVNLGASPRPAEAECEVVASFFAPDALYRMTATLRPHEGHDQVIDLKIHDMERIQRREAPRVRVSITAIMSNFDDPSDSDPGAFASVVGRTVDVGEGGCRVILPRPFPHGCDPTVTLELPKDETIVALSAVLQATATSLGEYEYRLVFLEMEEVDRLRLAELIADPVDA